MTACIIYKRENAQLSDEPRWYNSARNCRHTGITIPSIPAFRDVVLPVVFDVVFMSFFWCRRTCQRFENESKNEVEKSRKTTQKRVKRTNVNIPITSGNDVFRGCIVVWGQKVVVCKSKCGRKTYEYSSQIVPNVSTGGGAVIGRCRATIRRDESVLYFGWTDSAYKSRSDSLKDYGLVWDNRVDI